MKRFGLRAKFIVIIVALSLAVFGIMATVLVRQNSTNLRSDLNAKSKVFASLATTPIGNSFLLYRDSGQIKITQQIQEFTQLNDEVTNVAIVDTTGRFVFNQNPNYKVHISKGDAESFEPIYVYNKNGTIERIITPLLEENGSHRYNLVYSVSSERVEKIVWQTERSIVLYAIVGLVVTALLAYLVVSRYFVNPLEDVSRQALAISWGKFDQQIKVNSHDEVADLAKAVNDMAESLKAQVEQLREVDRLKTEFLMISAHNLRTPLTVINGYMDELKRFKLDSKLRHLLDTISVSNKRLTAFAEDMLTISQVESGNDAMPKMPTELDKYLRDITNDFAVLARQKKLHFTANITAGGQRVDISPAHFRSAIWNLLDNALKFTREGGWIKFEATADGKQAMITISDSGIGIAPDEMPKLFTKFHRGTSTEIYDYEGTGIGLYSSKLVIERLGGSITAASEFGQGSVFTIKLPLINSSSVTTNT